MKLIIRVFIFIALVVLIVGGIWYWKVRQAVADDTLVLYGNVDIRQVELAFNDSERIANILVKEGDFVEQNQLLAELKLEAFELAVARVKAQIETQQQVVDRLVAGTRPEEIREAAALLLSAKADKDDAEATWRRVVALKEKTAASQQDLDDALAKYNSTTAKVQLQQAALDLAKAGPRKEVIAEAKAVLQRLKVELDQANYNLKNASLYAPSPGVVQERILEVGDMASPLKTVFTLALVDPVWVRAYVSEPDLGKIHDGMKAIVFTDSFPGKAYEGWVGFISPTAEFTPKPVETAELRTKLVYQVRVFVKNPKNELRLGMPATVKIKLIQQSMN